MGKYLVDTVIQAKIVVEADSETAAYGRAEAQTLAVFAAHLDTRDKIITAARGADELQA